MGAPYVHSRCELLFDQIVHLERAFKRSEPFRAGRRPALPARIKRKSQGLDQAHHLGPCGDVREARSRSQRRLIQVVGGRQSAWKKLPIYEAFSQPFGAAKAQPGSEFVTVPLLPSACCESPAWTCDCAPPPNPCGAINRAALPARLAHHCGIVISPTTA